MGGGDVAWRNIVNKKIVSCVRGDTNHRQSIRNCGVLLDVLWLYRFPKNGTLRSRWVSALRRDNFVPSKSAVLCSEHFKAEDFDRTSQCVVRMKIGVIPSVFLCFSKPPHSENEDTPTTHYKINKTYWTKFTNCRAISIRRHVRENLVEEETGCHEHKTCVLKEKDKGTFTSKEAS